MYTHVIFDLDGTLLDTLDDLHQSVNVALTSCGYPTRTREEVRTFVGDGVAKLIERALPQGTSQENIATCLHIFKEIYASHCRDHTQPYPYILSLLSHLRDANISLAIVSNKFDDAVKALSSFYFGELVSVAVGEKENLGIRKKPYPDTVFEAMSQMGADPSSTVYIGDSEVDIATAQNAHIPCISVTWGFRTRNQLLSSGATRLFESAQHLEEYLLST